MVPCLKIRGRTEDSEVLISLSVEKMEKRGPSEPLEHLAAFRAPCQISGECKELIYICVHMKMKQLNIMKNLSKNTERQQCKDE